jgi:hypothetical protein
MTNNVGENRKPGTFVKGDVRCWRKGRPKTFDALRKLTQAIAHEGALKDGEPLVLNDHLVTTAERIMRDWANSRDPQLQKGFIEIAFGKVPDKVELTGAEGGPIEYARLTDAELDREIVAAARRISNGAEIPLEPPCAPATDPAAG